MNDTDMGQLVTPMSRGGKKRELMHKYGVGSTPKRRGGRMRYAEGGDVDKSEQPPKKSSWWELLQQAVKELTPSSPLGNSSDTAAPLRPYAPGFIRNRQQNIDNAVDAADHKRGGRARVKRRRKA